MAKRFYWLKLRDDFFHQKEIKKLRRIAGGDTYVIVYLKMLLRAAKTDGVLTWTGLEENFAEELALDLDEKDGDVEVTLAYLLKTGLAETKTGKTYSLPYVLEVVGSETDSAERMRRMRERQQSQSDALPSHSDREIDTKGDTTENTRDNIQKGEGEKTAPRPPALEDVRAYVFELGSSVDPVKFYDHYQSLGWRTVAGAPVADWKAMLRYWTAQDAEKQKPKGFAGINDDFTTGNPFMDSYWADQEKDMVTIDENGEVLADG